MLQLDWQVFTNLSYSPGITPLDSALCSILLIKKDQNTVGFERPCILLKFDKAKKKGLVQPKN